MSRRCDPRFWKACSVHAVHRFLRCKSVHENQRSFRDEANTCGRAAAVPPIEEPTVPSWRTTGDSENFAYQQCLQRGPRTTTNMLETKQTRHVNLQATSFQPLRREVARHPSHRKLFDAENAWQRRKRDPPMCLAKLATVSNAQPVRVRTGALRRRTLTSWPGARSSPILHMHAFT